MSRGGFLRRYPVLGIRDFRLLLADRLIAPASVGFSIVGVSFAVLKATNSPAALSYVLAAQIAPSLVIVAQFGVVLMAWYGAFSVLGPVVAREHLGGPAAWGAITAADAFGLIAGGLAALRFTPRRPMLFVVLTGGAIAISPLSLAMVLPLPAICVASFGLGVFVEMMMVQWTVTMARNIPPDKLARVSSYDVLGSVMAMPAGALIAGPLGAAIGASSAQYAAAAVIVVASALALIPREIRTFRTGDAPVQPAPEEVAAALEAV